MFHQWSQGITGGDEQIETWTVSQALRYAQNVARSLRYRSVASRKQRSASSSAERSRSLRTISPANT